MDDWSDINATELVWLAAEHNPSVHRGLDREILVAILCGDEVDLPTRRIDETRAQIMGYILEHWQEVENLLHCPARSKDPRACFNCTDAQVAECALLNPNIFRRDRNGTDV